MHLMIVQARALLCFQVCKIRYTGLENITAKVLGLSLCGELLMEAVTIEIALKAALVVMTCRHILRY